MKKLLKLAAGALVAAPLAAFAVPVQAQTGGFCSETQDYLVCCSTDGDIIVNCRAYPKPRVQ